MYFHIRSAVLATTSQKLAFQNVKDLKKRNKSIFNHRKKYHAKKQVQQDPVIPSLTKASSIKRHCIIYHKHVPNETEIAINSWCI